MTKRKKAKAMTFPFQPVRLKYGFKAGDPIQPITSVDPSEGGPGLFVKFSEEWEDPAHHHSDSGGVSFAWGPCVKASGNNGALVSGSVHLWIRDLLAPSGWGGYRTEIQGYLTKAKVSDYSLVDTSHELFSEEKYAPPGSDTLLWNANGDAVADVTGHKTVTKHCAWHWKLEELEADECMRFNVAQFHKKVDGQFVIPDNAGFPVECVGMPWPGHVWRAQLRAEIWPR